MYVGFDVLRYLGENRLLEMYHWNFPANDRNVKITCIDTIFQIVNLRRVVYSPKYIKHSQFPKEVNLSQILKLEVSLKEAEKWK